MLFNLGAYELVIIGVVFVVLVAWPVAAFLVARRRQRAQQEGHRREDLR